VRGSLFDILECGPVELSVIAARMGLPKSGAQRLLKAAAALDLVESRGDGRYALGPLGAALVGNDGVKAMILHHDVLYADLRDPLALLAGGAKAGLQHYWAYADGDSGADAQRYGDYTALMATSQAMVTAEILDAYPVARHRDLLDVGGGDGSFAIAAATAAPSLRLTVFDLPPVAAIASRRLAEAGLGPRARAHGGSFFDDPLPEGADLVTLNRVLHDHDDAAAFAILEGVRKAIARDGTLLITEPMAGTPGAKASGDAYFGLYLLAMGQGRPRTVRELATVLSRAGFGHIREVRTNTPIIARMLAATPVAG
jgi:demethylspheroidene O-methyltransferase